MGIIGDEVLGNREEIKFNDIIRVIKKRRVLIITLIALAILVSSIYSYKFNKPSYTAYTSVVLGKTGGGISDQELNSNIILNQNLIKTYVEILQSRTVAQLASQKLDDAVSAEQIQSSISVSTKDKTPILIISITSASAEEAESILNSVFKSFIEESENIYPLKNSYVLDETQTVINSTMSKGVIISISAIIGLLAAIGIVFIIECYSMSQKKQPEFCEGSLNRILDMRG